MLKDLMKSLERSLNLLEMQYQVYEDKNIIRIFGEDYAVIQVAKKNLGYKILKIVDKTQVDKEFLENLDCVNFDLEKGEYYILDNELWFEMIVANDKELTLSEMNNSIVNFCNVSNPANIR